MFTDNSCFVHHLCMHWIFLSYARFYWKELLGFLEFLNSGYFINDSQNRKQFYIMASIVAPVRDTKWLTLEVCRQFQRGTCSRSDEECKFAHPSKSCQVESGRVIACFDSLKVRMHALEGDTVNISLYWALVLIPEWVTSSQFSQQWYRTGLLLFFPKMFRSFLD